MRCRKSLFSGCLRLGAAAFAAAMLMGQLSLSARASTFQTVDVQNSSGPMSLSGPTNDPVYTDGGWTFDLVATNTSATQSLTNVNLVEEFVWDVSSSTTALNWDNVLHQWSLGEETFSLDGVSGGSLNPSFSLDPSNVNIPLSWAYSPGPDSVSNTDSVPAIGLGDFAPGQVKDFTLTPLLLRALPQRSVAFS